MDKNGITVPPGFIIPTDVCVEYMKKPKTTMKAISKDIESWMLRLNAKFGYMPLVSVRSGARVSMPGMMDTILNVGLDETNAEKWVERLGEKCVLDSRKRLIEMYGSVVRGMPRHNFEGKDSAAALDYYKTFTTDEAFPDAQGQLLGAIEAVFKSWNNERAKTYRKLNNIPNDWGTAVVIQSMVFGNFNDKSCTGVLFTRNPDSGADEVKGEFLINAQGEDVVAGIRTPMPLAKMEEWNEKVTDELLDTVIKLELLKRDVQDVEFTVQDGKLYILQTRNAKRSARAAVRIAVEMHEDKNINLTLKELFQRVTFKDYLKAQGEVIDPTFKTPPAHVGIPACSGVATGKIVRTAEEAVKSKVPCILVTKETTPDDIAGMHAAKGVLTMTGGATSHAAVVARSMNKPCVVGLSKDILIFNGDLTITIDGGTGRVWNGKVPVISGAADPWVAKLNKYLSDFAQVKVIGDKNADLLDVSDVRVDSIAARVKEALTTRDHVIVDLRPEYNGARAAFEEMFGSTTGNEATRVSALSLGCIGLKGKKIQVLTTIPKDKLPANLQSIAQVKTAEDLVLAEGDFLLDASGPWVAKLAAWKKQIEGANILRLGVIEPGGYASQSQLAHALLRQ
jgi:pyruvate,orthophosphate dikinase